MSNKIRIDWGLIIKLTVWSLIVGALLFWLELSPRAVYAWLASQLAGIWDFLVGDALEYILLGATIVVPLYLLMRLKDRMSRRG